VHWRLYETIREISLSGSLMKSLNNRILIVDDDPGVRNSIRDVLKPPVLNELLSKGASLFDTGSKQPIPQKKDDPYNLRFVENGMEAIQAVLEACQSHEPYAAAFMDMKMPGPNGAETSRRIWEIDPDIKIVIITAFSEYSEDEIVQITGRDDIFYLRKPFSSGEIKQFARALTRQWNLEKQKAELTQKLTETRDHEIKIAAQIQQSLLLEKGPNDFSGLEISQLTIPSQSVDGDFYDFIQLDEKRLDVIVGDVMGKGIPAAILGAAIKNKITRSLNQIVLDSTDKRIPGPETIVTRVQSEMITQLEEVERFVTLCYARFNMAKSIFSFVDCGHMRTIHYIGASSTCRLHQGHNMPIGFPEKQPFQRVDVPFSSGDLFLFYSDGLVEAKDSENELFGEDQLVELVQHNATVTPAELIQIIHKTIMDFARTDQLGDDFTCVAIKIV
ncbi:SpoIIE family protein phosphatase, partial [Desulfobacterales bacterium HSG17]|nr:SpoIIE family protein phosphatase [Desulfobacterales bacterium HSG17]